MGPGGTTHPGERAAGPAPEPESPAPDPGPGGGAARAPEPQPPVRGEGPAARGQRTAQRRLVTADPAARARREQEPCPPGAHRRGDRARQDGETDTARQGRGGDRDRRRRRRRGRCRPTRRRDTTAAEATGDRQTPAPRPVPGPRSPRPPHAGLRGVMAGTPLPPLGLGVAGRAPSRGQRRRERARADARTHGGPHDDGPAARRPGGTRRAGRGRGASKRTGSNRKRRRTGSGSARAPRPAPTTESARHRLPQPYPPANVTSGTRGRWTGFASLTSARRRQGPGRPRSSHPAPARAAGRSPPAPRPAGHGAHVGPPVAPASGHTPSGREGSAPARAKGTWAGDTRVTHSRQRSPSSKIQQNV